MRFENVCIESIAVALPEEAWTSAAMEERLRPLYERLRLPFGRLELMSGIRERRFWPPGTRPSDASAAAGRAVLGQSALKAGQVEVFIHAAVSRDMLEPATAAFAHRKIGLPATVHNERAENLQLAVDIVTARACAPLARLLGYARPYLRAGALGLFLKGQDVAAELDEASRSWDLDADTIPSLSDPRGQVVRVRRLGRARKV